MVILLRLVIVLVLGDLAFDSSVAGTLLFDLPGYGFVAGTLLFDRIVWNRFDWKRVVRNDHLIIVHRKMDLHWLDQSKVGTTKRHCG